MPSRHDNIRELSQHLTQISAAQAIAWAAQEFGDKLAFACSFGLEDMVVLDLLLQADPLARVFLLDTGRLHQETYNLIDAARHHYGRAFRVFVPQTELLETLLSEHGANSFYESVASRKSCCYVRKVEPLSRALAEVEAWLTGLRREQSVTRLQLPVAEIDEAHRGILKLNPLASWGAEDVWDYIREHHLPYNALHDQGFPSIGCLPCTRAIGPGEDLRAGRWWWEEPEHKECGLHLKPDSR